MAEETVPAQTPAEPVAETPVESPTATPEGLLAEGAPVTPPEAPAEKPAEAEVEKTDSGDKPEESKEADKPAEVAELQDLTLPKDSLIDAATAASVKEFAKERGLNQEQAQAILERENKALQTFQKGQSERLIAQEKEWRKLAEADKEIGGDAFNENLVLAKRGLEAFASEGFVEFLENSGLGSHPVVLKTFARIGKAIAEDKIISASASPGEKRDRTTAEILYGSND
jgi:hypothetical protein